MKRSLLFSIFIYVSLMMFSQSYYYNKGKKIAVKIHPDKCMIVSDKQLSKDSYSFIDSIYEISSLSERENTKYYQINLNKKSRSKLVSKKLKDSMGIISIEPIVGENIQIPVSNVFYVKLKELKDSTILQRVATLNSCKIERQVAFMPFWYAVSHSDLSSNSIEMSNRFYETYYFEEIDPGFLISFAASCTKEAYWEKQWGPQAIGICDAWNITKGNPDVIVGILDQGIDSTHSEFKGNLLSGYDIHEKTTPARIYTGHGTHVAGIIAANENDSMIVGIAPKVSLLPISSSLKVNKALSERLASGISWAWQNNASVINNSWGDQGGIYYSTMKSALLEDALQNALTQGRNGLGTVLVFASGNNYAMDYPGYALEDLITVGSISSKKARSIFCGRGSQLDVMAPGEDIISTVLDNICMEMTGTSMACPHVSGIAALMLSVNPSLTQKQVHSIINSTCTKLDGYQFNYSPSHPSGTWNNEVGYGLVDAYEAVKKALIFDMSISHENNIYEMTGMKPGISINWQVTSSDFNIEKLSNHSVRILANDYEKTTTLKAQIFCNNSFITEVTEQISSPTFDLNGCNQISCCGHEANKISYLPYGATLTWNTSSNTDIDIRSGDSIQVSTAPNSTGEYWIEATVNANEKLYSKRKILNHVNPLDSIALNLISTENEEPNGNKRFTFMVSPFAKNNESLVNFPQTISVRWNIEEGSGLTSETANGTMLQTEGEIGYNPNTKYELCLNDGNENKKPTILPGIKSSVMPEKPEHTEYSQVKDERYKAVVILPDKDYKGILTCAVIDDCGNRKIARYALSDSSGSSISNNPALPASNYSVFPNPVKDVLIVTCKKNMSEPDQNKPISAANSMKVILYNDFGIVKTMNIYSQEEVIQMNVSTFDNGIYYLNILVNDNIIQQQVVMIHH